MTASSKHHNNYYMHKPGSLVDGTVRLWGARAICIHPFITRIRAMSIGHWTSLRLYLVANSVSVWFGDLTVAFTLLLLPVYFWWIHQTVQLISWGCLQPSVKGLGSKSYVVWVNLPVATMIAKRQRWMDRCYEFFFSKLKQYRIPALWQLGHTKYGN